MKRWRIESIRRIVAPIRVARCVAAAVAERTADGGPVEQSLLLHSLEEPKLYLHMMRGNEFPMCGWGDDGRFKQIAK